MHNIIERIAERADFLAGLRRDIHAHPELGYEEIRTAGMVAKLLRDWGIEVTEGIAGTGVVGTLRSGKGRKSIGLTADMDALPIEEKNIFPHRSRIPGKMHGCGHDGHTAMLLGAAEYLSRTRCFDGTVHFIFRPAEEGGAGALRMIEEGLFSRFPCDAVFGMHNVPNLPEGAIGTRAGPITAGTTEVSVEIRGKGGHAARPHLAVDPVAIAAHVVTAAQLLVSRFSNPLAPVVLSITQIEGGSSPTIIPESVTMHGTIRTFSEASESALKDGLVSVVNHACAMFGATGKVHFNPGYPPSVCAREATALALDVGRSLLGDAAVFADIEPTMAGDDFSYLLSACPGAFLFIGNGNGHHRGTAEGMGPCLVHNPWFDFNDALLPVGAAYWAHLAETFLAAGNGVTTTVDPR
ncbi:amidohydrolase [Pandoraea terrae]|uniref:Amidohydrolase n=1 Tax=Pandoraea terrae TaxID=1537710 RepID=A0A5E4T1Y1_9BURK|nr:M20 aminoacylase family protein [Pandoraea terrae]VVD80444.1 amidohydrolase [Pandoraea terrae]